MIISKFPIRIKIALDRLHVIGWTKILKTSLLRIQYTTRKTTRNGKDTLQG